MDASRITLTLRKEQALVLLDWLSRFNEIGDADFEDQAEERVLWDLEAALETQLVEPFLGDFQTAIEHARKAVRDPQE